MDTSRLGTGTTIAAIAAIVLLVSMFLGWFSLNGISASGDFGEVFPGGSIELGEEELEASAESAGEDTSASAWSAFSLIDIVLALAIIAALALAATRAGTANVRLPVPLATIVAGLGALAAVLVLFRIISPPDLLDAFGGGTAIPDGIDVETDVGREPFVFVGLLAALGIAYGGFRAMQDESTTTARPTGGAAAAPPPPPAPRPPEGGAAPPPPAPGTTPPPPGTPGAPPPSGPTA